MAINPSILIVDDEETDRYLLSRDLKKKGYAGKIFEAEDGKSAIDFLTDFDGNLALNGDAYPPTLIFLDVNMPVMNGLEFLEAFDVLKAGDDRYQSVVIMMYTSSEQTEDFQKATSYPFVKNYMIKGAYSYDPIKEILNMP